MSDLPSGQPIPAQNAGLRPVTALARDLADFLVEFSIVLHKRAMYPPGHPHLQESAERFVHRLESLLQLREALAIGVARHQLIIAGVATDPRNALLSDLARRLHRHRIATARFTRGVTLGEIDDLLAALSADPQRAPGPLGLRLDASASWSHIQIQAPELNRLMLQEDGAEDGTTADGVGELWLGLANLALAAEGGTPTGQEDPLLVARAIDGQVGQVAYDRVVLDYLGQMAEEMSGRHGAWEPRARERVSRLVASLNPETLRRVLEAGADHDGRRRFTMTAAEVLAVDAVVEVVEAAAQTTGQTISTHLLRLLHKFAHHAEHGPPRTREEAESSLRNNVARLVANWELEDPNPTEYTAVLDGMVRRSPNTVMMDADPMDCDPETVLLMGLETRCLGPRLYAALDHLVEDRRLPRVAQILSTCPDKALGEPLWRHVATPERLRHELAASSIDFAAVQGLATQLGVSAVDPLLDALTSSPSRATRARAMRILVSLGPMVGPPAAARLAQADWFVQRNLLVLFRRLRVWPQGFSVVPYARHSNPRVRREAYRLLLEFPLNRASAVTHGLDDPDDGVTWLVLRAALESCPKEAQRAVERFIQDGRRAPELRALAVRVMARGSGQQALPCLLQLAGGRRLFRGWRLEPKSPVVLAALDALARYWGGHPAAAALLAAARDHVDPDIRLAAGVRFA